MILRCLKALAKVEENNMANGKVEMNAAANRFKTIDVVPTNAIKEMYMSIFTSSRKSNFKETFICISLPLDRD